MAPDSVWEIVFLMVILKIPIAYLCAVVYYAIKAEPRRGEGALVTARVDPDAPGPGGGRRRRSRRSGPSPTRPHGSPTRVYPRTAYARAGRVGRR